MVGVDADVLLFSPEGELAAVQGLELVVGLKVGPAPHPAVDDVGEALSVGHLQPPVQGAGDRHAFAWRQRRGNATSAWLRLVRWLSG